MTKDVEQADNGEVFDGVTFVFVIAILREPCDIKTFIILFIINIACAYVVTSNLYFLSPGDKKCTVKFVKNICSYIME